MDEKDDPHWAHCFHYMWQTIHCAADDTIEQNRFPNGKLGEQFISGGWDVRKCRSADKLYDLRKTKMAPEGVTQWGRERMQGGYARMSSKFAKGCNFRTLMRLQQNGLLHAMRSWLNCRLYQRRMFKYFEVHIGCRSSRLLVPCFML